MIVELSFRSTNIFVESTFPAPIYVEVQFGANTGGNSAAQNVFIQQAQPTATGNYLWVELNPDNSVKTFWVNS